LVVVQLVVMAVCVAAVLLYEWSAGWMRVAQGLSLVVGGVFLSWVHLAAAELNTTGRMRWPLPQIVRRLPGVYRPARQRVG
jgi:hypothetical protein